jgi:hypothetical protein
MAKLDEAIAESIIHGVREDGSVLTAIRFPVDGAKRSEWPWIVYATDSDGTPIKAVQPALIDQTGHPRYQPLCDTEELRILDNGNVEWQQGYYLPESPVTTLEPELVPVPNQSERTTEAIIAMREPESEVPEEANVFQVATTIERTTPSHTQKIIAQQINLSNAYYKMVGSQSQQSFTLAFRIAVMGAILFALCLVVIALPFSNTGMAYIGIIASAIIQVVAGLSYLYNKASAQLGRFQIYLDRINRAAISHAMCDELEDPVQKQGMVLNIVQELLKKDG